MIFDNRVVAGSTIDPTQPLLPSLPKFNRPVFNVAAGSSTSVIQQQINVADRQRGNRPIVHLAAGDYAIAQTLVIPAGSDLQLVGDGYNTALHWAGTSGSPMIRIAGPSHATFADFRIDGGASTGILVENADQANARVSMEQVYLNGATQHNLLVDRLDRTVVELHNFYHSGCGGTSLKVVGGASAAQGSWLGGRTNIFAGASSNSNLSYEVTNGGRLLVRDIWYESGAYAGFAKLASQGTFTLHGARIATISDQNTPAVVVDNFGGRVALLGVIIDDRVVVKGQGDCTALVDHSPQAQTLLLNSRTYASGSYAVANTGKPAAVVQGTSSQNFLRSLLESTRNNQPQPMTARSKKVTDLRLYRIKIEGGAIGIRLQK